MQHLGPVENTDVEEDLIPLLQSMALFLDRYCAYHEYMCHSAVCNKVCSIFFEVCLTKAELLVMSCLCWQTVEGKAICASRYAGVSLVKT